MKAAGCAGPGVGPICCGFVPKPIRPSRSVPGRSGTTVPRVRELSTPSMGWSQRPGRAEGRLYEIPMDARAILADSARALDLMEQAVDDAIGWGARIVGLGSMTGIVGNRGAFLAERHPIAVTTGNSLTVYATLRNLEHYCEALGIDLADEEVAVVGIPGSIATAVAARFALGVVGWSWVRGGFHPGRFSWLIGWAHGWRSTYPRPWQRPPWW